MIELLLSSLKFLPPRERVEFLDILMKNPELLAEAAKRFSLKLQAIKNLDRQAIRGIISEEQKVVSSRIK